jgi:biofilm PGA synthesis N-glycosyltransferase PgaC
MNSLDIGTKLLVITPVRNEVSYLPRTIECVITQTVRPTLWIIVDDGSSDGTDEIAQAAAYAYRWIKLQKREDRRYRKVGGGVVEAFHDGLGLVGDEMYEFIGKLDGDTLIKPTYFEQILDKFRGDPSLGIASGWIKGEKARDVAPMGPAKVYRSSCFRQIGGLAPSVGWDGADSYAAMYKGWTTRVFWGPEVEIFHLRKMGSSQKGMLHGLFRDGHGCYFVGYHPLYFLARVAKHCLHPPYVIGGIAAMWGFVRAWLLRVPRYGDIAFRRFVRDFQLNVLKAAVSPLRKRP